MSKPSWFQALARFCLLFGSALALFLLTLAALEQEGMPRIWIGYFFLFGTTFAYAGIGLMHRTSNLEQFFLAGRRVPALFNGMATAADWISAASFISLVGGLYVQGFDGLAYLLGWTGGYCLLAFLIAPYLRKLGQYTLADFLVARFASSHDGPDLMRILSASATILISFTYVIAQIYAVGLITSRFIGVDFATGIFLGLASILVCSFLGGMRSITWTQVTQYIILLLAFLLPTIFIANKHKITAIPPIFYADVLHKLDLKEQQLKHDPAEVRVRQLHAAQAKQFAQDIQNLPESWQKGRNTLIQALSDLRQQEAPLSLIRSLEQQLANYPKSPLQAQQVWQRAQQASRARAAAPVSQTEPYPQDNANSHHGRNNFLALTLCLMLGTAALPHILMRSSTTPSVQASRDSVFWALFFVVLLYLMIPALAVMLKYDLLSTLVGSSYAKLPAWVSYWANLDHAHPVLSMNDINHDGIVQFGEVWLDADILVLASPELAGLPSVFSGLIAVGALAAALSTADGLLLVISNTLSHDIYYKLLAPQASPQKRVTITKLLLLVVAFLAAYCASLKPADILSLVGAAFSLAASTLFPVLVAAIFWRRATRQAAICAMLVGFSVCCLYMLRCHPALGGSAAGQWWQIAPMSAGVFGVPAAGLTLILVSWMTPMPNTATQELIQYLRSADEPN